MPRREFMNFTDSKYWHYMALGTLSGVDIVQNVSGLITPSQVNPTIDEVTWEPKTGDVVGQARVDSLTRLVVMMGRVPGIGAASPGSVLRINRPPGTDDAVTIVLGNIPIFEESVPIIVENAFPHNLGKTQASPNLSDVIRCEWFVTPNEAEAHVVAISVFFLPTLAGGQASTGRGNILSGSAYY